MNSDQPKRKPYRYNESHKKPVTRRDLLGQGYLAMGAFACMPSIFDVIFARKAYALDCAKASSTRLTPFICFDLAGGGNIAGSNVIVGKQGGQMDFLAAYDTLGLPATMHPSVTGQLNSELGLAFHNDSAILRGIQSVAATTTRAKVDGMVFATASADDTSNNPHNPMFWVNRAGLSGSLVPLIGSTNGAAGGRSTAPAASINPAAKPVQIATPQAALGIVNPGKLATLLSDADVSKIMAATKAMSDKRLAAFQQKDLPTQVKELIQCGYMQSIDMTKFDPTKLDVAKDTIVTAVMPNVATNADDGKVGTIAKLVLDGYAGAGTIQLDGYDYHGQGRATAEAKDFDAGVKIGQVLEIAARKNTDVMIYVFTDGGVASTGQVDNSTGGRGKLNWNSDSGQRSAAFSLVYKKEGRIEMRNGNRQVGAFLDSGGVNNTAATISGSVDNLAKAVVANFLALHGMEGKLAQVVGDNPFGSDLDKVLGFSKLR